MLSACNFDNQTLAFLAFFAFLLLMVGEEAEGDMVFSVAKVFVVLEYGISEATPALVKL